MGLGSEWSPEEVLKPTIILGIWLIFEAREEGRVGQSPNLPGLEVPAEGTDEITDLEKNLNRTHCLGPSGPQQTRGRRRVTTASSSKSRGSGTRIWDENENREEEEIRNRMAVGFPKKAQISCNRYNPQYQNNNLHAPIRQRNEVWFVQMKLFCLQKTAEGKNWK